MGTRETPGTVVLVDYLCDTCSEPMKKTFGEALQGTANRFPHTCVNGHSAFLQDVYPTWENRVTQSV